MIELKNWLRPVGEPFSVSEAERSLQKKTHTLRIESEYTLHESHFLKATRTACLPSIDGLRYASSALFRAATNRKLLPPLALFGGQAIFIDIIIAYFRSFVNTFLEKFSRKIQKFF